MEEKLSSLIKIFPNPSSEVLHIEIAEKMPENIEIINQLGQIFKLSLTGPQKNEISIKSLPDGVYTLVIQKKSGEVRTRKFIKKS
jgi:hypothetical protein